MDQKTREEITRKSSMLADFPCLSEKKLVDECYNRTGYDMNACVAPITNYKTCKSFWHSVEKARRVENVRPYKPDVEERARIKSYYLKHRKLPKFPLKEEPS